MTEEDRKITCRKFPIEGDWYVIEWEEHDGRQWWEKYEYGHSLCCSSRILESDIEGEPLEMLEIAKAIRERVSVKFKRCGISYTEHGFCLLSPRNSDKDYLISEVQAQHLEETITRLLCEDKPVLVLDHVLKEVGAKVTFSLHCRSGIVGDLCRCWRCRGLEHASEDESAAERDAQLIDKARLAPKFIGSAKP